MASTVFAPESSEGSWPALKYNNLQADGKAEISISLFPYLRALGKEKAELELILTFNHLFPFSHSSVASSLFLQVKGNKDEPLMLSLVSHLTLQRAQAVVVCCPKPHRVTSLCAELH